MRNLWRAFKLVLPHRGMLVLYVLTAAGLASVGGAPLVLVEAFLNKIEGKVPRHALGQFVDAWLTGQFGTQTSYVIGLCAIALTLLLFKGLFDFANTYIGSWLAQRLRMEAMQRVMRKLLELDQPYFDKQKTGDLVARMVSDGDNLRKTVKVFMEFLRQPFIVAVLLAYALYVNPLLFCVGAIGVPLAVYLVQRLVRNISKQTKKYQEKTAGLAQAMLQNLAGIRIIHAYDAAEKEAGSFARLAESLFRTGMRRNKSRALQHPLTEFVLGFGLICVLLVGGMQALANPGASAASFVTFIGALMLLGSPVRAMMSNIGELAELLPSAERTFEILDVRATIQDKPAAQRCPPFTREIIFEKVGFDYGRGAVLKDVSFTLRAGESVGIVGRTGVGKSTLLALLLRFYDPTSGRILMDGVDIRDVTMTSLRAQTSLVAQRPFLFHASVADNIRYGRPAATDDEVIAAAQAAMIHDEIAALPEGYETLCGERGGELFSGGQQQRIAVARAVLRNAPILLLDEATSSLDAFSERRVQEALDKLASGRTSLIVAHRLSTLRNVNRILVVGEGGVVEAIAPHAELLEMSPTYRLLWEQQTGRDGGEKAAGMV